MVHARNSQDGHSLTSAEPGRQGGGRIKRRELVGGVEQRREVGWAAAEELRGLRGMMRIHDVRRSRANRLVKQAGKPGSASHARPKISQGQ